MSEVTKVDRIYNERPAYRILDVAGFLGPDDTLYPENTDIFFDGEPAVQMEPLNEAARIKMEILLEKLDSLGRAAAEKAGRPYTGLPRTLEGGLALATAVQRQDMSVMGNRDKPHENIELIEAEEPPTLGAKRSRGRPKKIA